MVTTKYSRWWSWSIGVGLAILPVYNSWITELLTNSRGETLLSLQQLGYLLFLFGSGYFVAFHWQEVKSAGWGDWRVLSCLLVIAGAIALSGITAPSRAGKIAPIGMSLFLLSLYFSSRTLGATLVVPITIGSVTVSLGVVVHAILYPGQVTGGFIFLENYNAVVGYILVGSLLYQGRWKWWVWGLGITAVLLTGSPEGVFCLTFLLCIIIVGASVSRKPLLDSIPLRFAAPVVAISLVLMASGLGARLYGYTDQVAQGKTTLPSSETAWLGDEDGMSAIAYRVAVAEKAMTEIKPLGDGYRINAFPRETVHNVPLIIVQQLGYPGVLAGIAWVAVAVLGLWKAKRWRMLWAIVLAVSVFDNLVWAQFAPWWWLAAGLSKVDG